MEPLFEAKATFDGRLRVYNIFRTSPESYKAQFVPGEDDEEATTAPAELLLTRDNGSWQTEDNKYNDLGSTLGIEIDVFNNGYGDLLGRIGVR